MRRAWLTFLISALLSACFSGSSIYEEKYSYRNVCEISKNPNNQLNLIDNVKYAFIHGYFKEKDFFQEKYLLCIFGGERVSAVFEKTGMVAGWIEEIDSAQKDSLSPALHKKYFDFDLNSGYGSIGLDFSGEKDFVPFVEVQKKFNSQWVLESSRSPLGPGYVYMINVLEASTSKSAIYFFFSKRNELVQITFKNGDK